MALSSLQAQLAALESNNPQPGISYSKSNRPEDAIGRGKSIRHDRGGSGSNNIPLSVWKERALNEVNQLRNVLSFPWLTMHRLEHPDAVTFRVLAVLSVQHLASVDVMLEYLLRSTTTNSQAVTPLLMPDFVFMILFNPTKLGRFIQYVDLTADPTFLWLRPYLTSTLVSSSKKSTNKKSSNKSQAEESEEGFLKLPPLEAIARHMWQNNSWFQRLLQTNKTLVDLVDTTQDAATIAPLVSKYLSWSVRVVVQALHLSKSLDKKNPSTSSFAEDRIRCLLPILLSSCGNTVLDEWRNWGYVVTSAVVDMYPQLRIEFLEPLVERIWQTAYHLSSETKFEDLELLTTALATILSILQPTQTELDSYRNDDGNNNPVGYYLELPDETWLGCRLSTKVFMALVSSESTSTTSSCLCRTLIHLRQQCRVAVAPLVVSLCVAGLEQQHDVLLELLSQSPLWRVDNNSSHSKRKIDLVGALSFHIVTHCSIEDEAKLSLGVSALQRLRSLDSRACERGVERALTKLSDEAKSAWSTEVPWLLKVSNPQQRDATANSLVLPPSVAIEHADPKIRLQAVRELSSDEHGGEESNLDCLLRTWSMEDDIAVASEICRTVLQHQHAWTLTLSSQNADYAIAGLEYWTSRGVSSVAREGIAMAAILARQFWNKSSDEILQLKLVVWLIGQFTDTVSTDKCAAAANAVLLVLGEDGNDGADHYSSSKEAPEAAIGQVKNCIVQNKRLMSLLLSHTASSSGSSSSSTTYQRRCLWVVLKIMADTFGGDDDSPHLAISEQDLLDLCLSFLGNASTEPEIAAPQLTVIEKCLRIALVDVCEWTAVSNVIMSLASIQSWRAYKKAVQPVVRSLITRAKSASSALLPPYAVLLGVGARPDASALVKERLLSLAIDRINVDSHHAIYAMAFGLCLLVHPNDRVRNAAASLLEHLPDQSLPQALRCVPKQVGKMKSSAVFGRAEFLSSIIRSCAEANPSFTDELIRLSVACISEPTSDKIGFVPAILGLISGSKEFGGGIAAATLLDAMEHAGEDAFPLERRWCSAGGRILRSIIASETCEPVPLIVEAVVRMLKGVKLTDPQIIISTGPQTGGGRSRAYSISSSENLSVLLPYPDDMVDAMVDVLASCGRNSCIQLASKLILDLVLGSSSWRQGVFASLSGKKRVQVASAVLSLVSGDVAEDLAEETFLLLPLSAGDINMLLTEQKGNCYSLSVACDFIRVNSDKLRSHPEAAQTTSLLFDNLKSLSEVEEGDDSTDYLKMSLLVAISELLMVSGKAAVKLKSQDIRTNLDFLARILGPSRKANFRLRTFRDRSAALSSLSSLCLRSPPLLASVLPVLVQLAVALVKSVTTDNRELDAALSVLFHVFRTHGKAASVSYFDVFVALIDGAATMSTVQRLRLFRSTAAMLVKSLDDGSLKGRTVASLVATILASRTNSDMSDMVVQLIPKFGDSLSPPDVFPCMSLLVQYGAKLAAAQQGIDSLSDPDIAALDAPVALIDVIRLATKSLDEESSKDQLEGLAEMIFYACATFARLNKIQRMVQRSKDEKSSLAILRFWQDLLVAEASVKIVNGRDWQFLPSGASSLAAIIDARQAFQSLLPAHVFLASISSILRHENDEGVREMALHLLAEQVVSVDSDSVEAQLYPDIVPAVVHVLAQPNDCPLNTCEAGIQQAALYALECLARALKPKDDAGKAPFAEAFGCCAALLQPYVGMADLSSVDRPGRELICSVSLTCSSLVKSIGSLCLPSLSKVVNSLLSLLRAVNGGVARSAVAEPADTRDNIRILRLSLLRGILAIVDSVPQFLSPHLPLLLSEDTLLSPTIRDVSSTDRGNGIQPTMDQVYQALAKVPCRLLIPAAAKAVLKCQSFTGRNGLARAVKLSLDKASFKEAAALRQHTLQIVLHAATTGSSLHGDGNPVDAKTNLPLHSAVIDLFLSMVLKLSELQLRQIYTSLLEWCHGEKESAAEGIVDQRKAVFWSLSSALSREVYVLYLPCLSSAMDDVEKELTTACDLLEGRDSNDLKSGSSAKRRRLVDGSRTQGATQTNPISISLAFGQLLQCLEHALRSDARDGGHWIRADGNRRFNVLLQPLGRLLCAVPRSTSDGRDDVLDGTIQCLAALAAAAGTEQLWKPLNHWVLQAASDHDNVATRQAGMQCLLLLLQNLGEEYMVLLPECLPVLSERLDDNDEDVASLARQCISLAEELIGESLEDNL